MIKQETSASVTDSVDDIWYLTSYPDVAKAGLSPQFHYRLHGKAEGRLPRPLLALQLSQRMWRGFAGVAAPQLRELATDNNSLEAAYAAWQLVLWHTSQPTPDLPETILNSLLAEWYASRLSSLSVGLICVDGLLRHERTPKAIQVLRRMLDLHGAVPDLCLAAANVSQASSLQHQQEVLAWVNRLYARAGLALLACVNPSLPLTLGNLTCVTAVRASTGPLLSVIMPVFNGGDNVLYAIESVLAQTWRNLQLIVVDDGSTDDTFSRIDSIATRDKRVQLLRLDANQGTYAARNVGLQQATGQFITTHDSDDWSHPQKFELLIKTLLSKPELVGAMCHWVRCTNSLYFKRWRMEDGLIHASVSTLMFRREVVQQLGRWDETRVAADTEYYERILAAFGSYSVAQILPQLPLVLARDEPGSLTNAVDTHRRTEYFGLRKEYLALARAWHRQAQKLGSLHLPLDSIARPFPAPLPILRNAGAPPRFDLVIVGDLGADPATFSRTQGLVQQALHQGKSLALFHWPDYTAQPLTDTAQTWYDMAVRGEITLLVPQQRVQTQALVFLNPDILRTKIDAMPKVHFKQCLTLTLDEAPARLLGQHTMVVPDDATAPNVTALTPDDIQRIQQSGLFDAAWYLAMYPDVRRAGINALQHYLDHGAREGREPNPYFNTAHYLATSPDAAQSHMLPLLHYLQRGFPAGHSASHPALQGNRPWVPDNPVVMFCAHAAGLQLFGAERSVLDVLQGFVSLQYNVVVCTPPSQNAEYLAALQSLACEVFMVACPLWVADAPPYAGVVTEFEEIAQRFGAHAVHVNTIVLREPLLAARNLNIPALVHVRESLQHDAQTCEAIGLKPEAIQAAVLGQTDHIVANSAFTARGFQKSGATHLVYNTVDLHALDLSNTLGTVVKVGLISSNQPKKGLQDLIDVATILQKEMADIELLVIGPENEHIAALRQGQKQGLVPVNVRFAGYAADPVAALRQVNVVVNLSHFEESFGRTVLEAMAARRPAVAYDWGALPELIEHGVNGFLAPHRDTRAVAQSLLWLSRNHSELLKMGEAGRHFAQARYGQENMATQLRQAYSSILRRNATGGTLGPHARVPNG